MKTLMCSVRDEAVGAFLPVFFVRSKAEAIRSFADAVGKSDTPFCAHPEDFTLFLLAEFDDITGGVKCLDTPMKLIAAFECRQEQRSE